MEERKYGLFAIVGPLIVYLSIIVSLVLSSWFNWDSNILSDLGNPENSHVASIFNLGLFIAGFLLMFFSLTVFNKHAKYSSYCLFISTFFIQLLALFNISYGFFHNFVAVLHFVMISITSIVYIVEKRSLFTATTFLLVMITWLLYILGIIKIGIAFPETISKLVLLWIIFVGLRIYFNKQPVNTQ
ncbi:DUF998 domain-containing protein [Candidatus Bathyarchaeota archaeon]|nr:DUF998 domain-containing protein [Candidatus Bathyarchaeota archaeon]